MVVKKRTKRKSYGGEHALQKSFFEWLNLVYPKVRKVSFAVPNGVRCSPAQGAKLKAEGLTAGIPDAFIGFPSNGYHGLFIEFKFGKNIVSVLQEEKIKALTANGYLCDVCYTIDEAMDLVNQYVKCSTI